MCNLRIHSAYKLQCITADFSLFNTKVYIYIRNPENIVPIQIHGPFAILNSDNRSS